MSRAYDAKQHALAAYPNDREKAIGLFLDFCDVSEEDFQHENNQTSEEYIFGDIAPYRGCRMLTDDCKCEYCLEEEREVHTGVNDK